MRKIKESLLDYAQKNDPDLLRDYSKSNDTLPEAIGSNSTIEVTWTCPYGHTQIESVQKRRRRGYCAVCGPGKAGSFAQNHPELLPLWSNENAVDPHQIPPTYTIPIKWICEHGHIHESVISRKIKNPHCPICRQQSNTLLKLKPELHADWDKDNNIDIDVESLGAYSNIKCHWICKNGHRYEASPAELVRRKSSCPVCASFGYQCPEGAKEWHPIANDHKTPFDFTVNSQHNAVFLCSECGNEYTSRIAYRAKRQSKYCPKCKKKSDL